MATAKNSFDNKLYLKIQGEKILERVSKFDKLYLEIGGKLFDDYHASRVFKGFEIDSKINVLYSLRSKVEIVIAINANDIQTSKVRSDIGLSYDNDVLYMIDEFENKKLTVSSVVITQFNYQPLAVAFKEKLENLGIKTYLHYVIEDYPRSIDKTLSDEGFGKNDYIETKKPIIVITAPGPGSGKMAVCLSQLYNENIRGIKAGYAKFETFPVWNLPLKHPVNLAYEAATADLNDINMIDPFHLEAYNTVAINYNRDIEVFPVLNELLKKIMGKQIYKSPTDMGVNVIAKCIKSDSVCSEASKKEIVRRYYQALVDVAKDRSSEESLIKLETIMKKVDVSKESRTVAIEARKLADKTKQPAVAIEYNGKIITGKTSKLMGASSAALLNAIKKAAGIPDIKLLSEFILEPIQELKTVVLKGNNPRLHTDEVLLALAINSRTSEYSMKALKAIDKLKGCDVHSSVILSDVDINTFKKLGMHLTMDPEYHSKKLYHK